MYSVKEVYRWSSMMHRCHCRDSKYYPRYGGRGIKVCERWHDYRNFIADIGEIPEGMSLDRIDNNGDYEPSNVRLATPVQQASNHRRNRKIEFQGRVQNLNDWAKELGIDRETLAGRLNRGWTAERTLTSPLYCMRSKIEFQGRAQTLAEWSRELGIKRETLSRRLNTLGWSVKRAMTSPVGCKREKGK